MSGDEADALVNEFILARLRRKYSGPAVADPLGHLARCDSARVTRHDMSNGEYSCDTGCEYARLTADISCEHGFEVEDEYGQFGDIGSILSEINEWAEVQR